MAILPSSGKPTAKQVVAWAKWLADNNKGVDVDGRLGFQCWDVPNYIFDRYWGFRTYGNADAMARRDQYPNSTWKIYANTPSFVPKPGDVVCWTYGAYGHTAIVVGPSDTNTFTSIDQNWYGANHWYGSKAAYVKHSYSGMGGNLYFIRPPYKEEPKNETPPKNTTPVQDKGDTSSDKPTSETKKEPLKEQKVITVTAEDDEKVDYPRFIPHRIANGEVRDHKPKGLAVKNAGTMCSVQQMYYDRNKYISNSEYPHFYIDRHHIWQPRYTDVKVPSEPDYIVIEVCGDYSDTKTDFLLNELHAIIFGVGQLQGYNIPLKRSSLKVSDDLWRTVMEHGNFDPLIDGKPSSKVLDKVQASLLELYQNRNKVLKEVKSGKTTKIDIKVDKKEKSSNSTSSSSTSKPSTSTSTSTTSKVSSKPKVIVVYSNYTFNQAVNIQMTKWPQINYGSGWYNAGRADTLKAMNSLEIWNSSKQKYQMLNLGKYQGISVSKLNSILKGKGTLSGQGRAVSEGCKKYNVNEIYLISHAFLESGYGRSNFASGVYGAYNYFGIGAYDNNPNYAMTFAKNEGWTTPAKAIIGGAKFVRQGYIDKGQQTLYRMRWNPQNPGNHQYATDVRWAQHQANTIKSLYDEIGLKGEHFIRDRYKQT